MPMPFRSSRLFAGAAISFVAACAIAGNAVAQVPASLLIGPDRLGSTVTYRITTSSGRAQSAPTLQTLALQWRLGQKVLVTLTSAGDAQATPFVATRAADGALTLDNAGAVEPDLQPVAAAVGILDRLDDLAATALTGAKTWKTTLVVQPDAPPSAPDAQSTPPPQQPLKIPVAATRSDDATGTTLAASGSIDRTLTRPAGASGPRGGGGGGMGGGRGMGGGGMGGGGMGRRGGGGGGDSFGSPSGHSTKVTTKITVEHFGVDGELTSGTIVETNQMAGQQSQPNPQSQPLTRTWQIDRT
jgi:hypothetical protein